MNIFEVETVKASVSKNGKVKRRTLRHEITFPSTIEEIKFKHWHDYFLLKDDDPEWAKEMEKLSAEKQLELMGQWSDEQWLAYYNLILRYLSCFTESDVSILAEAPLMGDGGNGLVSIYLQIVGMINGYQPQEIESFEYKGERYVVDKVDVDRFGRKQYGSNLTMNQVLDSLQYEHVFGAKDDKGFFIVKDRKYQIDIALCALLSKKVLPDGSFDERPLDFSERMSWTEKKILHMMDMDMGTALSVSFFLRSSNSNLKNTHTLHRYFRALRLLSMQKQ